MFKNSKNKIQFCIEKKIINKESPTFIIAEIGINHEGNFKLAKNLVDKAFKSGADAVKFQIVNPDHSYSKNTLRSATVPCAPRDSVIVVKLRTSENRTVASVSWPPIISVPCDIN